MAKAKTLKKRKSFSLDEMPIVSVKGGQKAKAYSPTEKLRDREFVMLALAQALYEGDDKAFKEILKAHYEAVNTAATLRKANVSKRTFYEALSAKGNPSLKTVAKIVHGLAMQGDL